MKNNAAQSSEPKITDAPRAQKRSRPVQVADQIKHWVVERDLRKGDKLPNEAAMIAQFGVSKGTVREAMRILEAQGLIVTKTGPGGGSAVGEVSKERAISLLGNYFYFKNLSLSDIYQLRKLLEPELVANLAGTLDEETLTELRSMAHQHPEPAKTPEEEKQQHISSLVFHARLADAAENELMGFVISFMARILSDLTVYHRLYAAPNKELWERGRRHQIDLVDALEKGERSRARDIMMSHMEGAERMMNVQEMRITRQFMTE
ncbi:GntR family transcriptional regulator [Sulfitobacter sp. F26204]|uniref:FadR/GntR family transcriptional regulator n=1 Tax=Sulfitobacter sp. F26204 TaxID=2996014 RepID=UPI00225E35D9|nr:GntR family transcriptional regulator [Sulfitobacter sp. F26204]MCX7561884.1 GntR family transcriptional regulator [Sulfitobacter sp. F26204]